MTVRRQLGALAALSPPYRPMLTAILQTINENYIDYTFMLLGSKETTGKQEYIFTHV
ncbi:MAG: hypothetical protein ACLU4N_27580 [Butyricimonas faecihominis]